MEWGGRRLSGGPLCTSLEKTESQPGHEKQSFLGVGTTLSLREFNSSLFLCCSVTEDALKIGGDRISND